MFFSWNISTRSASVSSEVLNTEKQMKARGHTQCFNCFEVFGIYVRVKARPNGWNMLMQHRAIFVGSNMLHLSGHHAARCWIMLNEVLLPSKARMPKNGDDLLFIFAQSRIQSPWCILKLYPLKRLP